MKVDGAALFKIVREVVRDEIQKSLPGMIEKVVTERYFRNLSEEKQTSKQVKQVVQVKNKQQMSLAEQLSDSEEDEDPTERIPSPENGEFVGNKGVYNESTRRELVNKLMGEDNPFADIYKDVKPLKENSSPVNVDVDKLPFDFEKMKKAAFSTRSSAPMPTTNTAEERRLAILRESLNVPAVVTK